MEIEVWLYGPMAAYAGDSSQGSYARVLLQVPDGFRMRDLLDKLGIPLAEKAITFVNGNLTDMPGMGADLDLQLKNGDRVGLLHRQSMWPYQYRCGAQSTAQIEETMRSTGAGVLHHQPQQAQEDQ